VFFSYLIAQRCSTAISEKKLSRGMAIFDDECHFFDPESNRSSLVGSRICLDGGGKILL
jgi:hypothetical protein